MIWFLLSAEILAGKAGKSFACCPTSKKFLVEGVNIRKRHTRPSAKMPSGGILEREMPVHASNVMVICPKCNKASRIGYATVAGTGGRKQKMRVCKNCKEMF